MHHSFIRHGLNKHKYICGRASADSHDHIHQTLRYDTCDVTRQTITSIEVGKYTASLPLAHKLARYFGLAIEDVFDFSDLDGEE